MNCSTDHRGIPVERSSSLLAAGSRCDLRRRVHSSGQRHGSRRNRHRAAKSLAESIRRENHRLHSPRVPRPRDRSWRRPSPVPPSLLQELLSQRTESTRHWSNDRRGAATSDLSSADGLFRSHESADSTTTTHALRDSRRISPLTLATRAQRTSSSSVPRSDGLPMGRVARLVIDRLRRIGIERPVIDAYHHGGSGFLATTAHRFRRLLHAQHVLHRSTELDDSPRNRVSHETLGVPREITEGD